MSGPASSPALAGAAPLGLGSLDALPAAVGRPSYARADLSAGIVHFGPGNFHRAHQAVYLDRLMESGRDLDWGIVGASVMSGDAPLRETLLLARTCSAPSCPSPPRRARRA